MSQHELQLDPALPLHGGLDAAFRDIIGFAGEMLALAPEDPERAVHDYRRSVRRARAMVSLLAPALSARAHEWIAGSLRAAFQGTSELRDHGVLLPALEKVAPAFTEPAVVAQLQAHIAAERGVVVAAPQVARILRKRGRELSGLADNLAAHLQKKVDDEALRESLRASFAFSRDAYRRVRHTRRTKHLHAWRKAIKSLRYQLELVASGGGGGYARPLRAASVQARLLGEVTDTMALRDVLAALKGQLTGVDGKRALKELDRVIRARLDEAIKVAAGFYKVAVKRFVRVPEPGEVEAEDEAEAAGAAGSEQPGPASPEADAEATARAQKKREKKEKKAAAKVTPPTEGEAPAPESAPAQSQEPAASEDPAAAATQAAATSAPVEASASAAPVEEVAPAPAAQLALEAPASAPPAGRKGSRRKGSAPTDDGASGG